MPKAAITEEGRLKTQERILKVAEEEFANNGYSGTRIVDIAKKAEANQALIHYYFQSKENLYQEVLTRLFREWEIYIQALSWKEDHFENVLSNYIRAHFEFQCRVPNLFKMHQWESLEGKNLFSQYVSEFWIRDMSEKIGVVEEWKREGWLREDINGAHLLYFIWGMMNQFYYRKKEELEAMSRTRGSLPELRERLIRQMIGFVLDGVRNRKAGPSSAPRKAEPVTILVPSKSVLDNEEARLLVDLLGRQDGIATEVRSAEEPIEHVAGPSWFVIAGTAYGELPSAVIALVRAWQQAEEATERVVGIWLLNDHPSAEAVQRLAEDAVNRTSAFAVSRASGMAAETYVNRFVKLVARFGP